MSVVRINAIEVPEGMGQGHARAESSDGQPVATHASLLAFEVVQHLDGGGGD